ncbi:hypothetical protein IV203_030775 [Nitzschia inconspicua]|uniref:Uncharacterized protein n=1 Tax=Nitzschia inconspicua TaxID=303405 RepID=A0A9K3LU05_9STRA|nr:hypothetical protein IV203_030775 [Nitzschia inconspicua]
MGTTESVPEEEDGVAPANVHPNRTEERFSAGLYPSHSPPRNPKEMPMAPSGSPRLRHGTHATQQFPSSSEASQQAAPRRRPPPPVKPVLRLEGLVVGGPKTGKRSLLQRLEGKNPFQNKTASEQAPDSDVPSILIPYKPPPDSLAPDRIQLHVQGIPNSLQHMEDFYKQQQQTAQFMVVLVSPKHKLETTQAYLDRSLSLYLDSLGYPSNAKADDGENYTINKMKTDETAVPLPVCICVLFNFRDLLHENSSLRHQLEQSLTEGLEQRNILPHKIVVDWIHVSLKNCYGLDLMHSFIYKTYLLRKETLLERQLRAVQQQQRKSTLTLDQNDKLYEEFVNSLQPTSENALRRPTQDGQNPLPDSTLNNPQQNSKSSNTSVPQKKTPPSRRTIQNDNSSTKQEKKLVLGMERDALEAFLASSDDEEQAPQKIHSKSGPYATDDEDGDDDDFFYDEKGRQRFNKPIHQKIVYSSDTSDDDDDDESETQSLTIKEKKTPVKDQADSDEDRSYSNAPNTPSENDSETSNNSPHFLNTNKISSKVEHEEEVRDRHNHGLQAANTSNEKPRYEIKSAEDQDIKDRPLNPGMTTENISNDKLHDDIQPKDSKDQDTPDMPLDPGLQAENNPNDKSRGDTPPKGAEDQDITEGPLDPDEDISPKGIEDQDIADRPLDPGLGKENTSDDKSRDDISTKGVEEHRITERPSNPLLLTENTSNEKSHDSVSPKGLDGQDITDRPSNTALLTKTPSNDNSHDDSPPEVDGNQEYEEELPCSTSTMENSGREGDDNAYVIHQENAVSDEMPINTASMEEDDPDTLEEIREAPHTINAIGEKDNGGTTPSFLTKDEESDKEEDYRIASIPMQSNDGDGDDNDDDDDDYVIGHPATVCLDDQESDDEDFIIGVIPQIEHSSKKGKIAQGDMGRHPQHGEHDSNHDDCQEPPQGSTVSDGYVEEMNEKKAAPRQFQEQAERVATRNIPSSSSALSEAAMAAVAAAQREAELMLQQQQQQYAQQHQELVEKKKEKKKKSKKKLDGKPSEKKKKKKKEKITGEE